MKRKHRFIVAGGLLILLLVFGAGLMLSKPSGQSAAEWWEDVAEIRSYRDFVNVVTGKGPPRIHWGNVVHIDDEDFFILQDGDVQKPTTVPMFGGTPSRNMVNTIDKNVPTDWNVEDGKRKNIKWVADLGTYAYTSPVIADGKVFVGTNNYHPRDPAIKDKNKAVVMAFDEVTGKFLWQLVHEMADGPENGFGQVSTPVVEGKRLYYATPGCLVVCADTAGKIQWSYDMIKELNVHPFHCAASSPLIVGDLVMLVTGNGVNDQGNIPSPKAPSFIAVNKNTGKLAWQSNLPGGDIIEGQWSNPTLATVDGKQQVIFPGGDCVLYSFEPETGRLIWKCDCSPGRNKKRMDGSRIENYIMATPVVVGSRLYVGLGPMPNHDNAKSVSYFLCLDITKQGDVSLKSYDVKDAGNRSSALVWSFGGPIMPPPAKGRQVYIGTICGTAAVLDGLVYVTEDHGYMHCLDAKTGQRYWDHDFKATVWGSPYCVDGRIYVSTEDGEVVIFEQGKNKKIVATNSIEEATNSTPVVAAGVLYVNTKSKLYAIANGK